MGKRKQFLLNQSKNNKAYNEKKWNEAKEDPALHYAMMCKRRLSVKKTRTKGI